MALSEGQVQVRDLVMGPGTPYSVQADFNPLVRTVRADQGGPRAWNDGSWSGAERTDEAVVPIPVLIQTEDTATWMAAHQALAAAFAASGDDVELRWMFGGVEYVMFGRPRMVEPELRLIGLGTALTKCAFVGLSPTIYSAVEHSVTLTLPSTLGGLKTPLKVPLTVTATVTGGRVTIRNAGTKPTGLQLRVDGPVPEPRISLLTDTGIATLQVWTTLEAGQWLDIDTAARTVYLNSTASRRGLTTASGTGWPVLPGGSDAELAFDATSYQPGALLTATWRDAWY